MVDNRKHPIRGLWQRNGKFFARLTIETVDGRKKIQWTPLDAATVAEAQAGLRTLLVERQNNCKAALILSGLAEFQVPKIWAKKPCGIWAAVFHVSGRSFGFHSQHDPLFIRQPSLAGKRRTAEPACGKISSVHNLPKL